MRGGCIKCGLNRAERFVAIMSDWEPPAPVFWVAAKFFKAKGAIRASKHIHANRVAVMVDRVKDRVRVRHLAGAWRGQ